ncbi:MAG: type II toxin-antitoxin system prevent-host-death family antitoxin [Corynebacterium sp.]|nr:type II toxin-antitoxin system prevent-host-death family antitoxin [Corynebacterium sp.]
METLPSRELRNHTASALQRVQQGETFEVTVNGRPVAQLGPLRPHSRRALTREEFLSRIPKTDAGLRKVLRDLDQDINELEDGVK